MSLFKNRGEPMSISKWVGTALSLILIPLFAIVIWQLASLNPELYCNIVKAQGVPPGQHCFELLKEGLKIKGWVIWLLIGTLAGFVYLAMSYLTKTYINVQAGPTGVGVTTRGSSEEERKPPNGTPPVA